MNGWVESVVANMMMLKAAGYDFETSWAETLVQFPYRFRHGAPRQGTLFGKQVRGVPDFMRDRLHEAWFGLAPEMADQGRAVAALLGVADGVGTRAVSRNVAAPLAG